VAAGGRNLHVTQPLEVFPMSTLAWVLLVVAVAALLLFDLKAVGRGKPAPSLREAGLWSAAWTALAVAFTGVLAAFADGEAAGEYITGFLIEKSLSLDNLFVFAVLLAYFGVPAASQRRVLVWGIAGAIVLRAIFVLVGAAALDAFHATIYVFGGLLVLTAINLARQGDDELDVEHTRMMRLLRRVVPIGSYDGDRFVTRDRGRRVATPLLACLAMVAAFDVLFAIDSVPAIFAVSRDTFVVFAANAFSLLGMTSLYFLLRGMMDRFHYLNYGLAVILAFVGVKMLLSDVWHMPTWVSLAVIVSCLAAAVGASLVRPAERAELEPA
jgi:tellurite resistance protein TerC